MLDAGINDTTLYSYTMKVLYQQHDTKMALGGDSMVTLQRVKCFMCYVWRERTPTRDCRFSWCA